MDTSNTAALSSRIYLLKETKDLGGNLKFVSAVLSLVSDGASNCPTVAATHDCCATNILALAIEGSALFFFYSSTWVRNTKYSITSLKPLVCMYYLHYVLSRRAGGRGCWHLTLDTMPFKILYANVYALSTAVRELCLLTFLSLSEGRNNNRSLSKRTSI